MQNPAADDREYWRGVLAAGGTTAVPRWVTDPAPGVGEHVAPIPTAAAGGRRRPTRSARCCSPRTPRCWPRCPASADVVTGYVPRRATGRCRARCRRARLVAGAAGPHARRRARAARPRRLPGRGAAARRAALRGRVRRRRPARRTPCCGWPPPSRRTPSAAAALPPRRARRRAPPPGSPATTSPRCADRRRPGRRARRGRACCPPRSSRSSSTGWPGPHRELPDRRFHELFEQRVRSAPGRRRRRARRPAVDLPASSTPGPTGWAARCWPAGCAARAWSRW